MTTRFADLRTYGDLCAAFRAGVHVVANCDACSTDHEHSIVDLRIETGSDEFVDTLTAEVTLRSPAQGCGSERHLRVDLLPR